MKRLLFAAILALVASASWAQTREDTGYEKPIVSWLDAKPYEGDARNYVLVDLDVPDDVQDALDRIGLSRFALLRNEVWARHGYVFKTELLAWLYGKVAWYKPDPAFGLGKLSGTAARNADWIKTKEDSWDYDNVGAWLDSRRYRGDIEPYLKEADYVLPESVKISANHLAIPSARLLRNELFARRGYVFADPVLARLFAASRWYRPVDGDLARAGALMGSVERANVKLCQRREILDDLEAVTYTLPKGVSWVPTQGYGAMFIREFRMGRPLYHFSSTDLWTALAFDPAGIAARTMTVETLVPPGTVNEIKAERDPTKKLILYFSNKRYSGYVDTLVFNKTDFLVPAYLADAVKALGIDWTILLRKEIHARNGAIFNDPRTGPIFRACPWYKARYNLAPSSPTRFPVGVKLSKAELANFALLEGEELSMRAAAAESRGWKVISDLSGNWYWAEIQPFDKPDSGANGEEYLRMPVLWKEGTAKPVIEDEINFILNEQGMDIRDFLREQQDAFDPGC